jgi:hypothetical protein
LHEEGIRSQSHVPLSNLIDESWITTGITDKAEAEFAQLFAKHEFSAPRLVVQADSMLTLLTTLMASNALAITLRQYNEFPLTKSALQIIDVLRSNPFGACPASFLRHSIAASMART